ncbi:MAG: hypothetical protein EX285_02645 [Thaumarchaeota archaeon]|nr:hypothetical protein [Nitrososphaerota archaeon]
MVEAILLDIKDPLKVIVKTEYILESKAPYGNVDDIPNVIFSTGVEILDDKLFVYYGI